MGRIESYPPGTLVVNEESCNCSSCGRTAVMGDYAHGRIPTKWSTHEEPGCGETFKYVARGACEGDFEEDRIEIQKKVPLLPFVYPLRVVKSLRDTPPSEPLRMYDKHTRDNLLTFDEITQADVKVLVEQIDYLEKLAEFEKGRTR